MWQWRGTGRLASGRKRAKEQQKHAAAAQHARTHAHAHTHTHIHTHARHEIQAATAEVRGSGTHSTFNHHPHHIAHTHTSPRPLAHLALLAHPDTDRGRPEPIRYDTIQYSSASKATVRTASLTRPSPPARTTMQRAESALRCTALHCTAPPHTRCFGTSASLSPSAPRSTPGLSDI